MKTGMDCIYHRREISLLALAMLGSLVFAAEPAMAQKKPNIVMLMTDDTGWNDFGAYSGGGAALGHPTPNIDRIAKEGAVFTNWYGQASCTAGRASFMTGRIPIRSALSIVVAPGDENALSKETPTIAEFFKKNGYSTYFSGKWHLGDKPDVLSDRARLRRDEGVRRLLSGRLHLRRHLQVVPSVVPVVQPGVREGVFRRREPVRMGRRGRPTGEERSRTSPTTISPTFDVRQADYAIDYIKKHAKDDKPFFMDVNFMKMHNPTNAAPKFAGKSHLGNYSDSMLELDDNIGRIMDAIRAEAPNTIVIVTADNGAWQDAYPDAGTTPFRGEKGSAFEGGWRVPGIMWWPGHIPAGAKYDEMMSHIDCWATLATMVGLTPPPHGEWMDNNGKPIYFDSIDNSAYILGQGKALGPEIVDLHRRRELHGRARRHRRRSQATLISTSRGSTSRRPRTPGSAQSRTSGAIGAVYNLTMDPYEKYDMTFNGAVPARMPTSLAGQVCRAGQRLGRWR